MPRALEGETRYADHAGLLAIVAEAVARGGPTPLVPATSRLIHESCVHRVEWPAAGVVPDDPHDLVPCRAIIQTEIGEVELTLDLTPAMFSELLREEELDDL